MGEPNGATALTLLDSIHASMLRKRAGMLVPSMPWCLRPKPECGPGYFIIIHKRDEHDLGVRTVCTGALCYAPL